jgi:hypothetical protein
MTCPLGFDAFGERGKAFEVHAGGCRDCADVVRLLGVCARTWKDEAQMDEARAAFRRVRLARSSRPARKAVLSVAFFVALGAASAWAVGRLVAPRQEPAEAAPTIELDAPTVPSPSPSPSASATVTPTAAATGTPPASANPRAPAADLWERGLASLERGDRAAAARLFRRVMVADDADPDLRRRATLRWALVLYASGDVDTPRDALRQLVHSGDAELGFEAALLLERGKAISADAQGEASTSALRMRARPRRPP